MSAAKGYQRWADIADVSRVIASRCNSQMPLNVQKRRPRRDRFRFLFCRGYREGLALAHPALRTLPVLCAYRFFVRLADGGERNSIHEIDGLWCLY